MHRTPSSSATAAPLDGIRVLDLSAYIAAPYGCTLLADYGATVIKIEPPKGDNLRHYPSTLASESRAFLGVNRGKLGMTLDLKQAQTRPVLERLLQWADVLVHNFRPGVAERLDIGYEQLRATYPRLVYCAVSGYGESGPMRSKAGYDQVLQAMTGICSLQGTADEPAIAYGSVVDYYAAALVSGGVTAALLARERNGHGQFVGVSLLRSALAMQSARLVWAKDEARDVGRDMRSGGITGLHPTADGVLYLSANTPHFWAALCELTNLPALSADPRYATVRQRAELAHEIVPVLRQALLSHSALEWETLFGERVPCAAVRPIEDMFDHPQVEAEHLVQDFDHPRAGPYRGLSAAVKFGVEATPAPARAAPALGEHTDDILNSLGYAADEIAALRAAGVAL